MTENNQSQWAHVETVLSSITDQIGSQSILHNTFARICLTMSVHKHQDVQIWYQPHA